MLIIFSVSASDINVQKTIAVQTAIYEPYIKVNDTGEVSGISHYIANEIFKAAGYKANFHILPYKRAVNYLFAHENGIMMGIFAGIPNYKKIHLTEVSYMYFPTTYFYNSKRHPEFEKMTDISQSKGKSIGILSGTGIYEKVITDSGAKPERVAREIQVFKLLQAERVDFAHSGLLSGIDNIRKNKQYKNLTPLKFNITNLLSGLVFRKGASQVKDDFIKKCNELHENGKLLKIFSQALSDYSFVDPKLLLPNKISVKVNDPKAEVK